MDDLCWILTGCKGLFQSHVLKTVSFYQPLYFLHTDVISPAMWPTWVLHSIGEFHSGITSMDITFNCSDFIINNNGLFVIGKRFNLKKSYGTSWFWTLLMTGIYMNLWTNQILMKKYNNKEGNNFISNWVIFLRTSSLIKFRPVLFADCDISFSYFFNQKNSLNIKSTI